MRRALVPLLALLTLAGCAPKLPDGLDAAALDDAVADAVGSPSTCVVVAKRKGGVVVYRYGTHTTCARSLPACDVPGLTTIDVQLEAARAGVARTASCDTAQEASRGVAWASAPLPVLPGKPDRQMVYAVFMEGGDALSGIESKRRLEGAFAKTGF